MLLHGLSLTHLGLYCGSGHPQSKTPGGHVHWISNFSIRQTSSSAHSSSQIGSGKVGSAKRKQIAPGGGGRGGAHSQGEIGHPVNSSTTISCSGQSRLQTGGGS